MQKKKKSNDRENSKTQIFISKIPPFILWKHDGSRGLMEFYIQNDRIWFIYEA